jgi:hypothetical protein
MTLRSSMSREVAPRCTLEAATLWLLKPGMFRRKAVEADTLAEGNGDTPTSRPIWSEEFERQCSEWETAVLPASNFPQGMRT